MKLLHSFLGNASQIDPDELAIETDRLLLDGEQITGAFKVFRDLFVFTQIRLILIDKQGLTGKKATYHTIPYRSITHFSVETAGHFDTDCELNVWIAGSPAPLKKEFSKGTDIIQLQRLLAHYMLAAG